MMSNNKFSLFTAFVLLAIISSCYFLGCAATTNSTSAHLTATLVHEGFDFTTGTATNGANYDGETISWSPDTLTSTVEGVTYAQGSYIWWRAASPLDVDTTGYQKHMGQVALSTITSIPTTWDTGSAIMPLLAGHSYVVKCLPSGYAKFQVTSVGTVGAASWPATVEYSFTTGSSFNP